MLHIQAKSVMRRIIQGAVICALLITQACGWVSSKKNDKEVSEFTDSALSVEQQAKENALQADKEKVAELPPPVAAEETEPQVQVIPADPTITPDVQMEPIPAQPMVEPEIEVVPSVSGTKGIKPEDTTASAPISAGPDHFVVSVTTKDSTHPQFGKGHAMGFAVNGVQGKELVLERGKTYKFEVATNPKHDVYFSTKDIGWGSSAWVEGVEGQYIYEGVMTISPADNTPAALYYSCRNHPYMGGKINVVNPGEDVQSVAEKPSAVSTEGPVIPSQEASGVTVTMVNQKLMFADMLVNSTNSQRVLDSGIGEAVAMHTKATGLLALSRKQLKDGTNEPALASAQEALELLKQSARLVPSEERSAELQGQYNDLLASISEYEKSHADNYARMVKKQGEQAAVDYDKKSVDKLKQEAAKLAVAHDYAKANQLLTQAQNEITVALKKMLHAQTIVYDLNFETVEEEYNYELKRFGGYEELIPVAIEAKNPSKGSIQLMETYLKKGRDMRDAAKKKAASGDFPTAIAMLLDATKEVRRALRMVGVTQ